MLSLRPMNADDLPIIDRWLRLLHVAPWWISHTTPNQVIAKYRDRITEARPRTIMLTATWGRTPIGWCQWYQWADYPAEATAIDAEPGEVGIDYAIGDTARIGRGIGTLLVAALVTEARRCQPTAGIVTTPNASNVPSRRVLEKNGFQLVTVRPISTEPTNDPMAIYRLAAP